MAAKRVPLGHKGRGEARAAFGAPAGTFRQQHARRLRAAVASDAGSSVALRLGIQGKASVRKSFAPYRSGGVVPN